MTVPVAFERYIILSLQKHLRDDARVTADGVRVLLPGERSVPEQADEDAIELHVLSIPRTPTRSGTWASGALTWQATCLARTANARDDHDAARPWTLAGLVRNAYEGVSVPIFPLGNATLGSSEQTLACLTPREADCVYLPEPSVRFPGTGGAPDTPSNLHAVAVTFNATLVRT